MTDATIDALAAVFAAGTPGPWWYNEHAGYIESHIEGEGLTEVALDASGPPRVDSDLDPKKAAAAVTLAKVSLDGVRDVLRGRTPHPYVEHERGTFLKGAHCGVQIPSIPSGAICYDNELHPIHGAALAAWYVAAKEVTDA